MVSTCYGANRAVLPEIVYSGESNQEVGVGIWAESTNTDWQPDQLLEYWLEQPPKPSQEGVFTAGYSDQTHWLGFTLINQTPSNLQEDITVTSHYLYLAIDYPPLDRIDLYWREKGSAQPFNRQSAGDLIPQSQHKIKANHSVFAIPIKESQALEMLVKVETTSSVQIPLTIWTPEAFVKQATQMEYGFGIFTGVMLIMAIYNLFIYFAIRDKAYLFYIGYIFSFTLFQLSVSGSAGQYFWPESTAFNQLAPVILLNFSLLFSAVFAKTFLNTEKISPIANKLINISLVISILSIVGSFILPYRQVVQPSVAHSLILVLVLLGSAIHCYVKGSKQARFFVLAWAIFVLLASLQSLVTMDLIPPKFLFFHGAKIGAMLEVALLSFALADRINVLQNSSITIQKEATRTLQRSLSQMAETVKIKDEFLMMMSHELRTPLNGIQGGLDLIEQQYRGLGNEAYFRAATQSVSELLLLIDELLEITEYNAGHFKLVPEDVEIESFFQEIEDEFAGRTKLTKIQFNVSKPSDIPPLAYFDRKRVWAAIAHLLYNALKFNRSEGSIDFNWQLSDKDPEGNSLLTIEISDTGIGIPKDKQEIIFEKFTQLDSSNIRNHGGIGVGLTLVKLVADQMQGKIEMNSEEHKGTRVKLELPITLKDKAAAKHTLQADEERLALIVEDNKVNQAVLRALLEKQKWKVLCADDGQKALDLLQERVPSIIFMDCQMPVMDGYESTRQIRERGGIFSKIPIIAVTANATSESRDTCQKVGMSDFLSKPIKRADIENMLEKWLHQADHAA